MFTQAFIIRKASAAVRAHICLIRLYLEEVKRSSPRGPKIGGEGGQVDVELAASLIVFPGCGLKRPDNL